MIAFDTQPGALWAAVAPCLLLWPMLLAALLVLSARGSALSAPLLPWAGLPALLLLILPDTRWALPPVLLGTQLLLDDTARWLLLLASGCWLLAGYLLRTRLHRERSTALWYLLALALTQWMVLAGESLLLFACATVAGYALLGLLLSLLGKPSSRQRLRVALPAAALLVLADLLLFEFFILLAHEAVSTSFQGQREVLAAQPMSALLPLLGAVGFGCRLAFAALLPLVVRPISALHPGLWPGLLAYALASGIGAPLRLYTAPYAVAPVYWLATAVSALLVLAAALLLAQRGTLVLGAARSAGLFAQRLWQRLQCGIGGGLHAVLRMSGKLEAVEQGLGRWSVALGLLLVLALLMATAAELF